MSDEISNLEVEQLALGELDEARAEVVRAKLEEAGDSRLQDIAASNREILQDYPPQQMMAAIERRLQREETPQRSPVRWMWIPVAGALAAAALVLALRPSPTVEPVQRSLDGAPIAELTRPDIEPTRLKGDPRLLIDRKTSAGSTSVRPGQEVSEGDRLQLSYTAAGAAHGVIVSLDGSGIATLHHPFDVNASTELVDRAKVGLDQSYELDDAPEFERFFLVTSDQPLSAAGIMEAALRLGRGPSPDTAELAVPQGARVTSVLLKKAQ